MKLTIPAAVDRAASLFGDRRRSPSRRAAADLPQLHDRVRAVAGAFIGHGLEPGDRVAIWSPNTHHWVLGALGALYGGLHPGAGQHPVHRAEALDVIGRSGARALFVAGHVPGRRPARRGPRGRPVSRTPEPSGSVG